MSGRAREQQDVADDRPLLAGKIHGLRRWSLELKDGSIRLGSAFKNSWWEPGGEPTAATCDEGSLRRRHRPPGKRCGCGLYALHPSSESATEVFPVADGCGLPSEISGLVEAWGRVEVHETGFRAQFARPVALILHRDQAGTDWGDLVARIARAYQADVLVVSRPEEVAGYCREHDLGLARGAVAELLPRESQNAIQEETSSRRSGRTIGDLVMGPIVVLASLVWVALWVAVCGGIAIGILGAIFGWFGNGSPSATALARKHLTVVDQAVLGAASREPVYVVVVKNDDPRRAALGVAPRLRVDGSQRASELARSGGFDHPANVPPAGVAVAFDRLPVVPSGALRQPRFHLSAFRRAPKFPVERVVARLDRGDCRLIAEVTASQRLGGLPMIGLARRGGRIVAGGEFQADRVPRGRSSHGLGRPGIGSCRAELPRWSLYPALALPQGRWDG